MRGILALALILAGGIFLLPFILGFVIFVLCALVLFMLLARFNLLPKRSFRTYEMKIERGSPERDPGARDGFASSDETMQQEGEVITLPESALRKEDGETDEEEGIP